jgi:TonB family protein
MSAALIFLASALSAPETTAAFGRRVQEYYPQWALSERAQTASAVELTVLPDGKITNCRVLESTGSARLAADACAGTIGLKLNPAKDGEGKPVYGMLRTAISLTLSAPGVTTLGSYVQKPDLELAVNQLPAAADHLDLQVALLVSREGLATQCEVRSDNGNPAPAGYADVACEQARHLQGTILRDGAGAAVPYVTNLRVRFGRSLPSSES